ncbi:hypothetical protein FDP41_012123 [Naegleria fowleri]|uniref:Uncharacterized protein n=1 Tax=Naegleria fowleri TaxID=5763 RepID=A0A6A5C1D5_NAEFO|nr:uncharacterized protein FDP41_012123 [Naegleria fowleri]KAF0981466.1 hypothetical protein FDP41_012123 [Naegleria fowleri]
MHSSSVKVKSDLELFVTEFDISEEDELQLEITLSTSVFKELLPMIRNYVNGELEDDKIGQIIKSDERIRKQLIENTQQGLTAQIQLELRRSVLEEKILIKLQELSERVVTFLTDMMVCDKHLELVWCDRNDEYNPREHTSINLIDKVIVDKALYPCLMMPSSRSVFEKAKVITKENREKKNKHICQRRLLKKMSFLDLSGSPYAKKIDNEGLKCLASSENVKNLTYLGLGGCRINGEGVKYIVNSEWLKILASLKLEDNRIGNTGVKYLATSINMKNLTSLELKNTDIDGEGVKYIVNGEHWKVTDLDVRRNKIGIVGVKYMFDHLYWANLTSLNLCGNDVGDEGVKYIVNSECTKMVTSLKLFDNNIGDEGMKYIANSEHMKRLTYLNVKHTVSKPKVACSKFIP